MNRTIKSTSVTSCLKWGLLLMLILVVGGCAPKKKGVEGLYPNYPGPQIAVEPYIVRLGIATLMKTQINIGGMGFDPGDSVFADIIGGAGENSVSIPLGAWLVNAKGGFSLRVSNEIKLLEILKLDRDPVDRKPIIVRNTIPPGAYVIKAESVKSGKQAECIIQFEPPSKMDRFKDWLKVKFRKYKKRT